ncbi:MAG: flagellar biosynthesis anti-sigma factor FlgM [Nitrospirae bacterium]|nr:flagellar biosynthesis anti-sigma factor FlgM [Nitrospirota bacterium]
MRISDNHPNSMLEKYLLGAESPKKPKGVQESSSELGSFSVADSVVSDSVQISPEGQEIVRLHQNVALAPDLSAVKASEIQKQISDGTYSIDPKQVAKSLVKETILNHLLS